MDLCLQLLKESNKSKYSVRNGVLIISHYLSGLSYRHLKYGESGHSFLVKPLRRTIFL